MDDQNKNLIMATALSFAVILAWFVLFPPPEPVAVAPNAETSQTTPATPSATPAPADAAQVDVAAAAEEVVELVKVPAR